MTRGEERGAEVERALGGAGGELGVGLDRALPGGELALGLAADVMQLRELEEERAGARREPGGLLEVGDRLVLAGLGEEQPGPALEVAPALGVGGRADEDR